MSQFIKSIVATIAVTFMLNQPVLAKDEPSIEETIAFIQKKFETTSNRDYGVSGSNKLFHKLTIDGCHFKYDYRNLSFNAAGKQTRNYKEIATGNFRDFDPEKIRVNRYQMGFTTTEQAKKITLNGEPSYYASFAGIKQPAQENALKLGKAFSHLILKCDGKSELF